jgi:hypothetical protein
LALCALIDFGKELRLGYAIKRASLRTIKRLEMVASLCHLKILEKLAKVLDVEPYELIVPPSRKAVIRITGLTANVGHPGVQETINQIAPRCAFCKM